MIADYQVEGELVVYLHSCFARKDAVERAAFSQNSRSSLQVNYHIQRVGEKSKASACADKTS